MYLVFTSLLHRMKNWYLGWGMLRFCVVMCSSTLVYYRFHINHWSYFKQHIPRTWWRQFISALKCISWGNSTRNLKKHFQHGSSHSWQIQPGLWNGSLTLSLGTSLQDTWASSKHGGLTPRVCLENQEKAFCDLVIEITQHDFSYNRGI
jgi:hypothetical protein